jgi:NAD(P)-dependent dehydrogenase (short-subunit alcohol dehydrogenase family)
MSADKPLGTLMVTGGTSPIGAAILRQCAHHASSLVSVSRKGASPVRGVETAAELTADFRRPDHVAIIGNWFAANGVDTLVNNAGVYHRAAASQGTWQDWLDVLSVNLIASAELSRLAVAAGCTRIVNIIDAGWHRAWPNHSIYLASKAGMVSLTRTLASEWAPQVQVNAVAPGIVTLPAASGPDPKAHLARIPAGRFGQADEIAQMVVAVLLSPTYLTGQVIAVDGGYGHR